MSEIVVSTCLQNSYHINKCVHNQRKSTIFVKDANFPLRWYNSISTGYETRLIEVTWCFAKVQSRHVEGLHYTF